MKSRHKYYGIIIDGQHYVAHSRQECELKAKGVSGALMHGFNDMESLNKWVAEKTGKEVGKDRIEIIKQILIRNLENTINELKEI